MVKDQQIEQQAGDACGSKHDREQDAQILSFDDLYLSFVNGIGRGRDIPACFFGVDDWRVAERTFLQRGFQLYAAVYTV